MDCRKILTVDHARPGEEGLPHTKADNAGSPTPVLCKGRVRIGLNSVSITVEVRVAESVYIWYAAMMLGGCGFRQAVRTMVRSVDLDPVCRGPSHLSSWITGTQRGPSRGSRRILPRICNNIPLSWFLARGLNLMLSFVCVSMNRAMVQTLVHEPRPTWHNNRHSHSGEQAVGQARQAGLETRTHTCEAVPCNHARPVISPIWE